jgi:hypothetical protein
VILRPGHVDGERIVHLTHTSIVVEALCGVVVDSDGEPDLAVICDACLELAEEHLHEATAQAGPPPERLPLAA